jgi:hypothetical protein
MDSISLPGSFSWVDLFEYISVSYVKPLEWAAVVEACDL